ncbi:MAG: glycosyltransferase family 39 protein [Planctomycetes bacterium]|nr:glycosyltransferase family 39 protein [Planctomycetota bacterium]
MRTISESSKNFWFFIIVASVVGTVLRLYMISQQMLLDDEWHGLNYTFNNTFRYIYTHFAGIGATSIPMNLYHLFLLKVAGWSELSLRAPSLAAGIFSLIAFPVLVKRISNCRTTIIFVFLLAISPFLIFYSRNCRPYSVVVFLAFISILSLYLWVTGQGRKFAVIYVIAGVLAVYFHLFAIIAVVVPLGYIFAVKLIQKSGHLDSQRLRIVPTLPAFALVAAGTVILLAVFLMPPLMQGPTHLPAKAGEMTVESLAGFASMLSGTANRYIVILFLGLLVFGLVRLLKQKPLLAGVFVSTAILYFAALVITRPDSIHAPIVISRYVIPLFPISFLLVAIGVESILGYLQSTAVMKSRGYDIVSNLIIAIFLTTLFFKGPLAQTYACPNNFTNHSAFQESYETLNWQQSYTSDIASGFIMKEENLPSFYSWLLKQPNITAIIEYPMDIIDHNNYLYYYQHFHKKRVLVGYITDPKIQGYGVSEEKYGSVFDASALDYPMTRMTDKSKLKFANMVDIMNIEAIKQSRANYVVLHKKYWAMEVIPVSDTNPAPIYVSSIDLFYTPVLHLNRMYRKVFGSPVFEDQELVVFEIEKSEK